MTCVWPRVPVAACVVFALRKKRRYLVSFNLVPADSEGELLIVTEKGFGKRTPVQEYPRHNRGGSGVYHLEVTDKTGPIATARVITEADSDLMIISASGVVIRTDISTVRVAGRNTQGVTLMGVGEGDYIVAIATTNGKKAENGNESDEENKTDQVELASDELTSEAETDDVIPEAGNAEA